MFWHSANKILMSRSNNGKFQTSQNKRSQYLRESSRLQVKYFHEGRILIEKFVFNY